MEYKFRPAARHIFTIGRDLIQNSVAAIIELVKNAYDADSNKVIIHFEKINDNSIKIIVTDNGHGMSLDTITNKWMVPSTDDKLLRRYSPKNRLMQGRKGIGRYAVSILGDKLFLESICTDLMKTSLEINWSDFETTNTQKEFKYLDEIKIDIKSEKTKETIGTKIEIRGCEKFLEEWNEENFDKIIKELRKLISPLENENAKKKDKFDIIVEFKNFEYTNYNNNLIKIEPYDIQKYFDYRLLGYTQKIKIDKINLDGFIEKNKLNNKINYLLKKYKKDQYIYIINFTYFNALTNERESFKDIIEYENDKYCGRVDFDLRIFDREREAILELIKRALKDPISTITYGINEARVFLNDMCGVSIYRGGFRIRPYGEAGYDWLGLDARRVQEMDKKVSSNQIIGFVTILGEEESNLFEKSARDGLIENDYFYALKKVILQTLKQIEERRYDYRNKTGRGRKTSPIEKSLNKISDYSKFKKEIINSLKKNKIKKTEINNVSSLIDKTEKEKQKLIENIKETIARYEGHVTLGKIVMIIMHEGSRPLTYFRNQIPLLEQMTYDLSNNYSEIILDNVKNIFQDILDQTFFFISLFDRIKILAVKKRKKSIFKILDTINQSLKVYENELVNNNIKINCRCNRNIEFHGWKEDFYITFTNLIDNSIYWLTKSYKNEKIINIEASEDNNSIFIDFIDNGIGIEKKYIEENKIFEPGFSTKNEGTGLGLSITGEALSRNNGSIEAIYNENGAYLKIELKKREENNG